MSNDVLKRMCDRQEITDMLHQYCVGMDKLDMDKLAGCFTDDGLLSIGPEPRLESRGASVIREAMKRMGRFSRSSHHLSNIQISFDGPEAADVNSYILAWHETLDGKTGTMMGQYVDRFVRTTAGWRISVRRLEMSGNDSGFETNVHRADRNKITT